MQGIGRKQRYCTITTIVFAVLLPVIIFWVSLLASSRLNTHTVLVGTTSGEGNARKWLTANCRVLVACNILREREIYKNITAIKQQLNETADSININDTAVASVNTVYVVNTAQNRSSSDIDFGDYPGFIEQGSVPYFRKEDIDNDDWNYITKYVSYGHEALSCAGLDNYAVIQTLQNKCSKVPNFVVESVLSISLLACAYFWLLGLNNFRRVDSHVEMLYKAMNVTYIALFYTSITIIMIILEVLPQAETPCSEVGWSNVVLFVSFMYYSTTVMSVTAICASWVFTGSTRATNSMMPARIIRLIDGRGAVSFQNSLLSLGDDLCEGVRSITHITKGGRDSTNCSTLVKDKRLEQVVQTVTNDIIGERNMARDPEEGAYDRAESGGLKVGSAAKPGGKYRSVKDRISKMFEFKDSTRSMLVSQTSLDKTRYISGTREEERMEYVRHEVAEIPGFSSIEKANEAIISDYKVAYDELTAVGMELTSSNILMLLVILVLQVGVCPGRNSTRSNIIGIITLNMILSTWKAFAMSVAVYNMHRQFAKRRRMFVGSVTGIVNSQGLMEGQLRIKTYAPTSGDPKQEKEEVVYRVKDGGIPERICKRLTGRNMSRRNYIRRQRVMVRNTIENRLKEKGIEISREVVRRVNDGIEKFDIISDKEQYIFDENA